ncbi:MAG: InlB B-repeat-containing protein [Lachnospiraceae bacterium]|nr:InlB B-repeat-containing protein [Lachnospiraceae bacterium]
MKGDMNWKKFLALFMAVAMVMASGIFVTTQSFKATDDEYYEADESEDMESVDADEEDYEEEEVEIDEEDSEDEEDFDEEEADEETADAEDEESEEVEEVEEAEEAENAEELQTAEVKSVKVTFDLNGGEGNETPEEVDAEASEDGELNIDLPDLADYTDGNGATHIFEGWSTDAGATEGDDSISADGESVELYAIWSVELPEAEVQPAEEAQPEEKEQAAEEVKPEAEEQTAEEAQAESAEAAAVEDATEEEAEEAVEENAEEQTEEAAEENAEAVEEQQLTEEELAAQQLAELMKTMPEGNASESAGNVSVEASWDVGVFPEGTVMQVEEISPEEALAAVSGEAENATEAYAVNITFIGPDGSEVQPANEGGVNVSLSLNQPLMGEEQTLVHIDDSGNVEEVSASTSETGADFTAESFSIYVLYGNGEDFTNYEDRSFDYSIEAYQELTLAENAVNSKGEYLGGTWEIVSSQAKETTDGEKGSNDIISFMDDANLTFETGETQPTVAIETSGKAGEAVVTYTYKVGNGDNEQTFTDTYTIHIKGYTVHFDLNGGSGEVEDQSIGMTAGGTALVQLPSGEGLTREGYNFKGWSTNKDAMTSGRRHGWYDKIYGGDDDNVATLSDMFPITKDAETYTLYAMWAPNTGVSGQIGFFIRDDGTIQTEPASYSSSYYTTVTPGGSYYKSVSDLTDYITEVYTETDVEKIGSDGSGPKITARAWSEVYAEINKNHKDLLQKYPGLTTDGEGYYITWYVVKDQGSWHVDGVIRGSSDGDEGQVNLDYLPNISGYTGQCPAGRQYKKGTEVTVEGRNTIVAAGYTFVGWNTKADGSGFGYKEGDKITLKENTTLYAQWVPSNETPYTLLCYNTETGEKISDATKIRYGTTGNTIKADESDKTLPGYTFDEGNTNNVLKAQIKADGSTTLILWFNPGHAVKVNAVKISKIYDGVAVTDPLGEGAVTVDGDAVAYELNNGSITFTYKDKTYAIEGASVGIAKDGASVSEAKDVGNYDVTIAKSDAKITKEGKATAFTLETNDGYINISKRTVVITSKSGEWEYDGKAHTLEEVEVTGDGWAEGDSLPNLKFTGSQKAPGESDNTFEKLTNKSWEEEFPNYSISTAFGKLVVTSRNTKFQINVVADSFESPYDGTTQKVDKNAFTIDGAAETEGNTGVLQKLKDAVTRTESKTFVIGDETFTLSGLKVTGEGKDVSDNPNDYAINFDGKETIRDADGHDVTEQFEVNKTAGKLTITKVDLTLTSKSETKVYDGNELTNGDSPLAVETGWIDGEGATYEFSGSVTDPGESTANAFTITEKNGTNLNNYNVIKTEGTLSIVSSNASYEVTVTPNSLTTKYDGTEKSVSGFVGETAQGIPVTANGKTYYVTGLTAGATGTNAGETGVTVSGTAAVKNAKGKDVTTEFAVKIGNTAKLVIEKRNITLTSASLSKEYDGTALTNPVKDEESRKTDTLEVEATDAIRVDAQGAVGGEGLAADDVITYTFTGSQKQVGGSSNSFTYELTNAGNYNVEEPQFGTLTIRNRDAKYEITLHGKTTDEPVYDGQEHGISGFIEENEDGTITITVGDETYTVTGVTSEVTATDAGEYPTNTTNTAKVTDSEGNDVTEQFAVTVVPGKLIINKAEVTLQSADLSKAYDGKALTNGTTAMAVESGWAEGEGAAYTFTGSQTIVGSSANSYTYTLLDNTKADNYIIHATDGTLTITNRADGDQLQVQIQAKSDETTYDGKEHTVSGFENETDKGVAVEVGGETYYVTGYTSTATGKDANGEGAATKIEGSPVVKDKDGNDVTAQFAVVPQAGTLKINKRDLVLESASPSKPYDGKPLTNGDTPLAKEKGWAENEGATYSFTGSQTIVGTSANAFTINPNEGTKLDNYNLAKTEGTLTVTSRDAKYEVTIQGKSLEATYDGKSHTVSGFEEDDEQGRAVVEVEGQTYYVTGMTSTKTGKNVKDSGKTVVSGTPIVTDAQNNDVSDQFAVTALPGKFTIGKRKITLTSEDKSKVYDGYPLTGDGSKVTVGGEGLADGETLDFTFTGSQTLAGSSDNSFTYRIGTVGGQIADSSAEETGFLKRLFAPRMVVHAAETEETADESTAAATAGGDISNYDVEVIFGKLTVTADGSGKGDDEDGPDDVDPSKVGSKTHEDGIYAIGQEVNFTLTATNIYADTRNIEFVEQEGVTVDQNVFEGVAAGETVTTTAHYTVTEADAVSGNGFTNHLTIRISDAIDGGEGSQPGRDFGEYTDDVVIEEANSALTVVKKSDKTGAVRVGETIGYTIEVVNNGNTTISNIKVTDELTGDSWDIDTLTSGGGKEFEASYTVTEADVAAGKVTNVAIAKGTDSKGEEVTSEGRGSNDGEGDEGGSGGGPGTVTNDVNQSFNLTIHYVDENGNPVAADYQNSYQYKQSFYVESPKVSGYTPTYTFVSSDENGMPAKDVDVTVTYVKNETVVNNNDGNGGGSTITRNDSDDDDDDDDDVADDSTSTSKNRDTVNKGKDSNKADAGVNSDGSTTTTTVATPEINDDQVRRSGGSRTGTDGGATITLDDNGEPNLVSASDAETPLFNIGLGDHKCNVLRLLILLAAFAVVLVHTKKMRQYQSRLFELREKLEEEKK